MKNVQQECTGNLCIVSRKLIDWQKVKMWHYLSVSSFIGLCFSIALNVAGSDMTDLIKIAGFNRLTT